MQFYDANLSFGVVVDVDAAPQQPCPTVEALDAALQRAGVAGGLVRTEATDVSGVAIGNELLRTALAEARSALYGMYTLVPRFTHEIPAAHDLPAVLKAGKFAALRLAPRVHRFLPKAGVLADYLEMATALRIPVMFDTACGIELGEIYDILERFPRLTAILAYQNIWPADRMYRPFLAQFDNVYMELSSMITDQGIDDLVREYGAERLLYGTRFPYMYMGGQMLQLRHACISEEDKARIAGGNLLRLIEEEKL